MARDQRRELSIPRANNFDLALHFQVDDNEVYVMALVMLFAIIVQDVC